MKRKARIGALAAAAAVLIAAAAIIFLPASSALEMVAIGNGKTVWCARMEIGEEFVISYVHSVNRRPVYDTLRMERDRLVIVQSRFDAFGAGIPEYSPKTGRLEKDKDGWLICPVDLAVPEVRQFVGRVADHHFQWRNRLFPLTDLVPPGGSLSIRPSRISLVQCWMKGCLDD